MRGAQRQGDDPPGSRMETEVMLVCWRVTVGLVPPSGLCRIRLATLRLRQAILLLLVACVCDVLTQ